MIFSHQPGCSISSVLNKILKKKKIVVGFAPWMQDNYVLLTLFEICCSIAKWCLTLCDPMDCSMQSFPILHYLLVFAQTHIHWVSDAIQSSHPLSPPSPPALYLSQHQSFFQWVNPLHHMAKVLELFSFSISPSNEYSGLISFQIDRFDLPEAQGTVSFLIWSFPASLCYFAPFDSSLENNEV